MGPSRLYRRLFFIRASYFGNCGGEGGWSGDSYVPTAPKCKTLSQEADGSVRFVSVLALEPLVLVRVALPLVPVHTDSGSYRFTVQADPLTGHKLGQISSHRCLSTIFVDQRFALVLFTCCTLWIF